MMGKVRKELGWSVGKVQVRCDGESKEGVRVEYEGDEKK